MGEVKQTNFRIDQDTAAAFRKFCEDNGMNQAQGFDHVMQVVELDKAKTAAPGRATEIETFEKSIKDIMTAYLNSLEINAGAEARIREQFAADLTRKDRTIDELREKVEQLQSEKEAAETVRTVAESREKAAIAQMESAQRTAADQERINSMLTLQLTEATEKLDGAQEAAEQCRALEAAAAELRAKLTDMERALENEKKAAESSLAQAKMQAELDTERAVITKEREMQTQLREADKENAKLSAMIEQLQKQSYNVSTLQLCFFKIVHKTEKARKNIRYSSEFSYIKLQRYNFIHLHMKKSGRKMRVLPGFPFYKLFSKSKVRRFESYSFTLPLAARSSRAARQWSYPCG